MNNKVVDIEKTKKEEFIDYLKEIGKEKNNQSLLMTVLHKT